MIKRTQKFLKTISALGLMQGSFIAVSKLRHKLETIDLSNTKFKIKPTIFLRPNSSDPEVFMQVFVDKEYDINIGFAPKYIIDGGANIGLASIYFNSKFPDATIISIEPDEENVAMMKVNLAAYANIHIKQASIWSKPARTKMVDKYNMGKWAMVTEELTDNLGADEASVNTVTINDIMSEFNLEYIDVLKLDIESAEKQLFNDDYMSWLPKTKVVIIELHDWMIEGCSKPFFSAINRAFSNYKFSQIGENTVIINRDLVP